ncbi:sterol carrier family protein [Nocardiopsis chromatogenes]|uniref:sterol carrier family protein n=1 Tax=Nocardiopsis chromatogenes TaxID=280239 RepID=UPI00035CF314|nr:sterol carrier family protein [Nocardiopsis chromatogenes]
MPSRPTAAQRRQAALREALDAQRAALDLPPYDRPDRPGPALWACVDAVLEAYRRGASPVRAAVRAAVRGTLDELSARAPGHALEVRVPPFGAVQAVEGPRHTRGTPPGVVEAAPRTWLELAAGLRDWDAAVGGHAVAASGERADLGPFLPLRDAE